MRPSQLRARIAQLEAELHRLKATLASTAYLNPERQQAFLATRQKVLAAFAQPILPSAALKASRLTRQSFTRHFRKLLHQGLIIPASDDSPPLFVAAPRLHASHGLSPAQLHLLAQQAIDAAFNARYCPSRISSLISGPPNCAGSTPASG